MGISLCKEKEMRTGKRDGARNGRGAARGGSDPFCVFVLLLVLLAIM